MLLIVPLEGEMINTYFPIWLEEPRKGKKILGNLGNRVRLENPLHKKKAATRFTRMAAHQQNN